MAEEEALADEPDLLRDTPVRLLGYANEVGEGFRPVAPRLVLPTYVVALGYVLADTAHKYSLAASTGEVGPQGVSPALAAADTLVWQLFASVAVPGLIINRAVWFAQQGVERSGGLPEGLPLRRLLQQPSVRRWLPTVAGLALIPFIVEPVDKCEWKDLRPLLARNHTRTPARYEHVQCRPLAEPSCDHASLVAPTSPRLPPRLPTAWPRSRAPPNGCHVSPLVQLAHPLRVGRGVHSCRGTELTCRSLARASCARAHSGANVCECVRRMERSTLGALRAPALRCSCSHECKRAGQSKIYDSKSNIISLMCTARSHLWLPGALWSPTGSR